MRHVVEQSLEDARHPVAPPQGLADESATPRPRGVEKPWDEEHQTEKKIPKTPRSEKPRSRICLCVEGLKLFRLFRFLGFVVSGGSGSQGCLGLQVG